MIIIIIITIIIYCYCYYNIRSAFTPTSLHMQFPRIFQDGYKLFIWIFFFTEFCILF